MFRTEIVRISQLQHIRLVKLRLHKTLYENHEIKIKSLSKYICLYITQTGLHKTLVVYNIYYRELQTRWTLIDESNGFSHVCSQKSINVLLTLSLMNLLFVTSY